jgi:capsular exopolysaccharide synthesis family protein
MNKQSALQANLDDGLFEPLELTEGFTTSEELSRALRSLWSTFYRNRLLIAAIVAVAMVTGLGVTMMMTPKYQATASIQIDQQSTNVLGDDKSQVDPSAAWSDADRFLQTQIDVLKSQAMARTVTEDLGLATTGNFVRRMGGLPAEHPTGALNLADTREQQIVRLLQANLKVDLPRDSRVAKISFTSPDPQQAARIANAYAADFMMFNMKRKFGSSTYARSFLEGQLNDTRAKLETSERALLDYARGANLLDVSGGIASSSDVSGSTSTPRSLTTSNLVQLNDAYAQAKAARVAAQQHWEQAAQTPPMQLQEVLNNQAVAQLSQSRAEAQAAYQQDLQRHKPGYPQMQQAAAHIAELDRQIATLAQSIRASIKDQYETALKQEQALGGQVAGLKSSTQNEQNRSVEYNILKRAVDTNRTMYDSLLQRFAEVSAQAGVAANNISQVDTATVPLGPVSPKPMLNLALAGFLGLVVAGGFVLLRDKFDDSIRTPEDVPTKLGLTFLNSTPLLDEALTPQEALDDPRSALSEAYAALRASIELGHKGGTPRTLSVTSTRQSEGKSTTAYAIARNFAKIGRSVVLIDGDLRKPSLHRLANVPNHKGFSNLLAQLSTIEETLSPTDIPNLSLIAAGPMPPNPAELLSGSRLPDLVTELAKRFDIVIFDAPPVLGLADTILIGAVTEATLFAVEANGSHHGHAKAAVRRLSANGVNLIGAVLTKYDARKIGYGYGYGYNYSYSYSYGQNDEAPREKSRSLAFWKRN